MEELPELVKAQSKDSFASLLGKTLLIVLSLAVVAVFVSWSFGWVAVETYTSDELYSKIVSGRPEVKRMAAVEWSRQIARAETARESQVDRLRPAPEESRHLGQELLFQSEVGTGPDLIYTGALATLLGYSRETEEPFKILKRAAFAFEEKRNNEALLYVILALARLDGSRDIEVENFFIRSAQQGDASLRKASVVALDRSGAVSAVALTPNAAQQLRLLLQDSQEDVRWNAAFALARRKDLSAKGVLWQLLKQVEIANENVMQDEILNELFRAVKILGDEALTLELKKISKTHDYPKLRHMAEQWLEKI